MFDIIDLKSMLLPELQDIAQKMEIPKFRNFNKLDLIYQILDFQAANPNAIPSSKESSKPTSPQEENTPKPRKKEREQLGKQIRKTNLPH